MQIPKNWNIDLPYDPAISLLGVYLREMKSVNKRAICTSMFIAAQFIIAKTWNKLKHSSTEDWKRNYGIRTLWNTTHSGKRKKMKSGHF